MTRDEIEAMEAGRELDTTIHIHVMGWRDERETYDLWLNRVPRYSTDIGAAWQIVEHVKDSWIEFTLEHYNGVWTCASRDAYHRNITKHVAAQAPTAPLAICRAVLLSTLEPAC